MGVLTWLFRKRMIQEVKRYDIKLYHDQGHDITLTGVAEKNLKFIGNNLGKDVIYAQDDTFVNLGKFSIVTISLKNRGEEKKNGK